MLHCALQVNDTDVDYHASRDRDGKPSDRDDALLKPLGQQLGSLAHLTHLRLSGTTPAAYALSELAALKVGRTEHLRVESSVRACLSCLRR